MDHRLIWALIRAVGGWAAARANGLSGVLFVILIIEKPA